MTAKKHPCSRGIKTSVSKSPHRATIEHPLGIGQRNKRILDNTTKAYSLALDLAAEGFNLINLNPSLHIPQIVLMPTGHCRGLKSGTYKSGRDQYGHYQQHVALRDGCELTWTTRTSGWVH